MTASTNSAKLPTIYIVLMYIFVIVVCFGALFSIGSAKDWHDQVIKDEQTLAWYRNTFQTKNGWTKLINSPEGIKYNLLSVDAGKSWYNVNETPEGIIKLTPADPALIKSIEATALLMSGKGVTVEMLRDAGFSVEYKEVKK